MDPQNPLRTTDFPITCENTQKLEQNAGKPEEINSEPSVANIRVLINREPLTTKKALELLLAGTLKAVVCRYCLNIGSPLSELDQILRISGRGAFYDVTIRDMVATFHPFKVVDDPNFPNKVCDKCLDQVIRCYLFAQRCEQSERAIRNCYDDMFDKVEKLDPLEPVKKRGKKKLHPNHNILYSEHRTVMEYAEPIRNLINSGAESFTNEPEMSEFECTKCWQVLPNIESLVNHQKIHPKTMWYNCRLCGKSFQRIRNFKSHLKSHKKPVPLPLDDKFECKLCYHSTDNHVQHLQHIENHKFKRIFQHLVDDNMDKLCTVCLDAGKLVSLDKTLCIHGGYPELTGDRTLYNILGSTIPEPKSYKYQELFVPCLANVTTITRKYIPANENSTKQCFAMSLPIVISADVMHCDKVYLFLFTEPSMDDVVVTKINDNVMDFEKSNPADNPCLVTDEISKGYEKTLYFDNHENYAIENHISSMSKEDFKFTFRKPDYVRDETKADKDETVAEGIETDADINGETKTKTTCNFCWIFKEGMCEKCSTVLKHNEEVYMKKTEELDANCKFCWVFKNAEKCDICKKSFTKGAASVLTAENRDNYIIELKNTITKRLEENYNDETDMRKWQCPVCLTSNTKKEKSCICCDTADISNVQLAKMNFGFGENTFLHSPIKEQAYITENAIETEDNKLNNHGKLVTFEIDDWKNSDHIKTVPNETEQMETNDIETQPRNGNGNNPFRPPCWGTGLFPSGKPQLRKLLDITETPATPMLDFAQEEIMEIEEDTANLDETMIVHSITSSNTSIDPHLTPNIAEETSRIQTSPYQFNIGSGCPKTGGKLMTRRLKQPLRTATFHK